MSTILGSLLGRMSTTHAAVQVVAVNSLDVHRSVELGEREFQSRDSAFFHAW